MRRMLLTGSILALVLMMPLGSAHATGSTKFCFCHNVDVLNPDPTQDAICTSTTSFDALKDDPTAHYDHYLCLVCLLNPDTTYTDCSQILSSKGTCGPADTRGLCNGCGSCDANVDGSCVLNAGEECDDGNNQDGDGCDGNCRFERCGDGNVDSILIGDVNSGEQCDTGGGENPAPDTCASGSHCGAAGGPGECTCLANEDACPDDPNKTAPGICGCGAADADGDGDGFFVCSDCDEDNPNIHPGAEEVCNGVDDNCNGLVDEGCGELAACQTINQPPAAGDDSTINRNDKPVEISVLDNDSDPDGGPRGLLITSVTALDGGSASISADGKKVIYTPDPKVSAKLDATHLTYEVFDGDSCNGRTVGNVSVQNFKIAGGPGCSLIRERE